MPAFRANWVFDGTHLNADTTVVLDDAGRIDRLTREHLPEAKPLEGLLMPGLINAHCHLEFSHLQGRIPAGVGMVGFIRQLMALRDDTPYPEKVAAARHSLQTLHAQGVALVFDTANSRVGADAAEGLAGIEVLPVVEVFSSRDERAAAAFAEAKTLQRRLPGGTSITPHAPYSVAPTLWRLLAAECSPVWSYHLLESREEQQWFAHKTGPFAELVPSWGAPSDPHYPDPIAPLEAHLPRTTRLGAVHLTEATAEDLARLRALAHAVWFVLCPQANQYLHGRLPGLAHFQPTDRICLGTDSLAGTWRFDLVEEMRLLQQHGPHLPPETILAAVTRQPAEWLGVAHRLGSLKPGTVPGLTLVDNVTGHGPTLTPESTARRVI